MMSLSAIRNIFLAPAFVAALLAAAAGSSAPAPPPPPVTPPLPPAGTQTLNSGVILTDDKSCDVAYKAANLGSGDIENQLNAFRSTKYQLPPLKFYPGKGAPRGAQEAAHNHAQDMIEKNYIALIDFSKNNKARSLPKQLRDENVQFTEAKMIVLVGCFGLTVLDAFNAMDANAATKGILTRSDWTHVGADVHHPDESPSPPGIQRRNYWVFIFYK